MMKRLAKPEGRYNLVVEDAPIPEPAAGEVRLKAVRSLDTNCWDSRSFFV